MYSSYVTYSNLGIGIGLVTGLLPVVISEYFDKKNRAGAVGLSYSGAAVGAFIFPLIFESLISFFHLQPSLLIMGGITLLAVMGAVFLTPFEEARTQEELMERNENNSRINCSMESTVTGESSCSHQIDMSKNEDIEHNVLQRIKDHMIQDAKIISNPYFFLISIVYIAYIMGNVTFLMILPDFAIEVGLSKSQGIFLLSIFSVTDLLGRLTPLILNNLGWKSEGNQKVINNKFLFVTSISMLSIIFFLFPLIGNASLTIMNPIKSFIPLYYLFLFLTLVAGFFSGFQMILPPVLLSEYLGPPKTAVAFGLSNFICGILSFSRPFIIEVIRDRTSSYDLILYIFACFAALTSLCWIFEIVWSWSSDYNQIKNKP